ncbi:hypothetical protein [Actinoplanes couchii]|nr:hypothetical protein [Actinoplanes couchii]MDR6318019.1 plasmid stabilization system protein ParE [Actinoplanes couchii]
MTTDYTAPHWSTAAVVPAVRRLVDGFRRAGRPSRTGPGSASPC